MSKQHKTVGDRLREEHPEVFISGYVLGQRIHEIICENRAKVDKALDADKGLLTLIKLYTELTHNIEAAIKEETKP